MTRLLLALAVAAPLAACEIGGGTKTFPVAANCSPAGNACGTHSDCCSFGCEQGICVRNLVLGGVCRTSDDCDWTMTCVGGACAAGATCRNDADVCTYDNACCSGNCAGLPAAGTCQPNHPPTVDLGSDRTVPYFATLTLDPIASDQDGDTLLFGWTLVSGPAGNGLGPWTSSARTPSVLPDVPGAYVFRLVVTDGPTSQRNRLTAQDEVTITAVNDPPAVNAGADVAGHLRNVPLTLTGSVADPNGAAAPVTCTWYVTPPGGAETVAQAFDPCPASPAYAFTPPISGPEGDWAFRLEASDGMLTASDVRTVQVVNAPPVADAGADRVGNVGSAGPPAVATSPVPATATATDANGDSSFTYAWTFDATAPGSTRTDADLTGADGATVSFVPDQVGRYVLRVQVCDRPGSCGEDTVAVDVQRHILDLGHPVADAEWAAGKIYAVGADPAAPSQGKLWVYSGGVLQQSVSLPTAPRQVGVDPSGTLVVTGDDVWVRWVSLAAPSPTPSSLAAPYAIGDLAVASTRYAVLFPSQGTPFLQILDTQSAAFDPTGRYGRFGTVDPSANATTGGHLFAYDTVFGDLTDYTVQNPGTLNLVRTNVGYACAGRLWSAQAGGHLFDSCGEVYASASLTYVKSLGVTGLQHLHSASGTGEVVALDGVGATLRRFDASFDAAGTEPLPAWGFAGTGYASTGKFAFVSSDGQTRWVIVTANGHTGLVTFP